MGKRFCFFLVQTLGILLIFRWENWTRTIRSGPWNKIEQKKFKTEKNETIPISVFLIFIRAFSDRLFRLSLPSLFWMYCFLLLLLYVFNIYEVIYTKKVVKGGTQLVSLRLRLGFTNKTALWAYLTIGWEIIRVAVNSKMTMFLRNVFLQVFSIFIFRWGLFAFPTFTLTVKITAIAKGLWQLIAKNKLYLSWFSYLFTIL